MILDIAIILFIVLESMNVIILYVAPDFKQGNGISVFSAWDKSKSNEEQHLFIKYLVNWVAGSKLIFIALLVVIVATGSEQTKFYSLIAMILSVSTYFWKLNPIISKLDGLGQLSKKGYAKTLFYMIVGILTLFSIAVLVYVSI